MIIVELIIAVTHSKAEIKYFSARIDAPEICENDNMLAENSQQANEMKTFPSTRIDAV